MRYVNRGKPILALKSKDWLPPVHVPASDRTSEVVAVFGNRQGETGLIAGRAGVAMLPFHDAPAVVPAALDHLHLWPLVPADVTRPQQAGRVVALAPTIAHSDV